MTDAAADLPPQFPAPLGINGKARQWLRKLGLAGKASLVVGLALAMLIPLGFVQGVIGERIMLQAQAVQDIRALWGGAQQVAGPMLQLRYRTLETGTAQTLWLQPDSLSIRTHLVPEIRYRGLFQTVVYRAEIDIAGSFPPLARAVLGERPKRVDWADSRLLLGVADPRSLILPEPATFAGEELSFEPSAQAPRGLDTLAASVAKLADADPAQPLPFHLKLRLNGSSDIAFLPLARTTEVAIDAAWDAPSFFGRFAPDERQIGADGFSAHWHITHLGTALPQVFDSYERSGPQAEMLERVRFGVGLMQPIGAYRESERAAKYGLLFVGLTLGTWLLFEIAAGVRVHPLQYALVGGALCVFYLLLLSFAEQLGFARAYLLSAAAVVLQTSAYTLVVTRRWRLAALFAIGIACLYGYLFVLLRLETQSLIGGSLLLFAVLSLAMSGTRGLAVDKAA